MIEDKSDATKKGYIAMASPEAVSNISEMMFKIGADKDLPKDESRKASMLSDFWRVLYLENHLVPDDVPFDIIIAEFVKDLVQGVIIRKGNNQAAICQCFNDWMKRPTTTHRIYQIRDRKYPSQAPKQLSKDSFQQKMAGRPEDCFQWPVAEVKKVYEQYQSLSKDWQAMVSRGGYAAKLERTVDHLKEQGEW